MACALAIGMGPAFALYKCGNTYQDTPCTGATAGGKADIYEDRRTETQRWDAEVRRVTAAGQPFLAKHPYIYSYDGRTWWKEGFVNGKSVASIADPSEDRDLARLNLSLKQADYDASAQRRKENLAEQQGALDLSRKRLNEQMQELDRQVQKNDEDARMRRREIACRGRSGFDPVCADAR